MKVKRIRYLVFFIMLCLSYSVVYGNTMELFYDGESHLYQDTPISMYVDGRLVETTEMPPIQFNGYTLVPAREVFEETGAMVLWKSLEQKVYVDNGSSLIILEINSQSAWVNGSEVQLGMPAKVINGKVMIPTRFVGETLGYKVVWNAGTHSVHIQTKGEDTMAPVVDNLNQTDINNELEMNKDKVETNVETNKDDIGFIDSPAGDGWLNLTHIFYFGSEETLKLSGLEGINAQSISVEEQYHKKQIIINLNKDYSRLLPAGTWFKQNGAISTLVISHLPMGTQIVLTTRTIQALKVYEQEGEIVLKCVKPSEKYERIVVVDAGHGDQDPGASYAGIQEKDLTLKYALALGNMLEQNPNIKVYLTRLDDTFLKLDERTAMANEIDPDLFISIHINSAAAQTATGIETYYTQKADGRNKTFATMVQNALISTFGARDRGVKSNTYVVTKNTNAPAILIEIGFITNSVDRAMMTADGFDVQYANVLYQCILDYYDQGLNQ